MRKIKTSQEVSGTQEMKVENLQNNNAQIEIEIDRHVKSIQCLIRRLTPADRQKYYNGCLLYTSPSPRDRTRSRMPSSA